MLCFKKPPFEGRTAIINKQPRQCLVQDCDIMKACTPSSVDANANEPLLTMHSEYELKLQPCSPRSDANTTTREPNGTMRCQCKHD